MSVHFFGDDEGQQLCLPLCDIASERQLADDTLALYVTAARNTQPAAAVWRILAAALSSNIFAHTKRDHSEEKRTRCGAGSNFKRKVADPRHSADKAQRELPLFGMSKTSQNGPKATAGKETDTLVDASRALPPIPRAGSVASYLSVSKSQSAKGLEKSKTRERNLRSGLLFRILCQR